MSFSVCWKAFMSRFEIENSPSQFKIFMKVLILVLEWFKIPC